MARPRVLIEPTRYSEAERQDFFTDLADVVSFAPKNRAEFLAAFQPGGPAHGVVGVVKNAKLEVAGPFDEELVGTLAAAGVKYVASEGAGYDPIDVEAVKRHEILVTNTPEVVDPGTATTALYLTISGLRLFAKVERDLRAGKWKTQHDASAAHDLEGRTLAILGMGGIGLRFAQLARPFDMKIIYHNRKPSKDAPEWVEYYGVDRLDEFYAQADVLSVHIPLNKSTEGYVGEEVIRKLKRGSVLVNTARGKVVDEAALIRALEDGHLGAVGLDVFPNEPHVNPRLLEFSNATLLPHMGSITYESVKAIELRAITNLRDFVKTGTAKDIIPELRP